MITTTPALAWSPPLVRLDSTLFQSFHAGRRREARWTTRVVDIQHRTAQSHRLLPYLSHARRYAFPTRAPHMHIRVSTNTNRHRVRETRAATCSAESTPRARVALVRPSARDRNAAVAEQGSGQPQPQGASAIAEGTRQHARTRTHTHTGLGSPACHHSRHAPCSLSASACHVSVPLVLTPCPLAAPWRSHVRRRAAFGALTTRCVPPAELRPPS